jgi:ACS family D-galactonate transporter-like MFS transporter
MIQFTQTPKKYRRRWGVAWLLGVGVLINYFDRINLSVASDALHSEFGITAVQFGYLSSAFNWTYAALQLPIGVLLDRFGVKRLGRIGAFLWTVATFGAALAPGAYTFFGMRLLLGIGEAPSFPSNAKAVGRWFPRHERSLATAMFDAAAKFGPAVGVLVVGGVAARFGWRWSFAATGALSLGYFVVFSIYYRDPDEDRHLSSEEREYIRDGDSSAAAGPSASLGYLLRQRKVIGLGVGFFGYSYCLYLLLYWMPAYFSSMKLDTFHSLVYSSVPWVFATAVDLFVGGWLVDALVRRGYPDTTVRKSVLIVGTCFALAIAGAISTKNPAVAVFWFSIALGGLATAAPVGWSIPSLISPRNSVGKVSSILNFGIQSAGIVSPIVTGYITDATHSFSIAFAVGAVLLLSGIPAYLFLLGKLEPVPEP